MRDSHENASTRAVNAMVTGASCVVVGLVIMFSPLVWGERFSYNKYLIAVGLILTLLGASVFFNGGFDWIRARRQR